MREPPKSQLTSMTAGAIAAAIRERQVSVCDVVAAHIERIEEVQDINAVIWPLFDQAMEQARAADQSLREGTRPGPLFGVPMTIKDQFRVRDTPTTVGLAHRRDRILDGEGPLVSRLRELGAIFLGKTNLPQLLVSWESDHGHYGRTLNPLDRDRAPGGSSGGEAAIIAAHGSPLGLGADMSGSIRVPAHCCGIHGLKPTSGRFPNDDTPLDLDGERYFGDLCGFEGFQQQPGPMARSVDDLKLLMDGLLSAPLISEEQTPPVPWEAGPIASAAGLRVGFFTDNGFFPPSPAIRRSVEEAAETLRAHGLEVAPFSPPDPSRAIEVGLRLISSEGGRWIKQALQGEEPIPALRSLMRSTGIPGWLRPALGAILRATGQETTRALSRCVEGACSSRRYWQLVADRNRYRAEFMRFLDQNQLDILLCPPFALPAPVHGTLADGAGLMAASYSLLFNVLGMPAGTVTCNRVRPNEESDRPQTRDRIDQAARRTETGSAGLPVGVQVAGRPWREDQVLGVMKVLEACRQDPAHAPT